LEQDVDSKAVGEVDTEIVNSFSTVWPHFSCLLHLVPNRDLSFNPFEESQDALERASKEHIMTDTE